MIPDLASYQIESPDQLLTPALLLYADAVDSNIAATLRILDGDPNRWRPHLKTAKMQWVIKRLLHAGVRQFKCATTRELTVALQSGAHDVLLAFPVVNANARRVLEIAEAHPEAKVSVLVENASQVDLWRGTRVGIFVDVNPGMDRTGVDDYNLPGLLSLASSIGAQFRGIHYYDGHVSASDRIERELQAHMGYDRLLRITAALENARVAAAEVVTSGTPAFPYSMTYRPFGGASFLHRASPGTVLFNDATSLAQLPEEFGYRPAAIVLSTVVSHPKLNRITCDAGHKSVSADAGVPTCVVLGRPDLEPLRPSEEHLPIAVPAGSKLPPVGSVLYLLPRHVCPTVNNFDEALLVRNGHLVGVEPVAARGHEAAFHTGSLTHSESIRG